MKIYYYQLYLSSGAIFWFYNNRKVLTKEYKKIVENIMKEISIINDQEEPYICANDSFYKLVFEKMNEYGFVSIKSKIANYDIKQLIVS